MTKNQKAIADFFKDYQLRFSQETVRSYSISIKQFFDFCHKGYDQVTRADVRDWLAKLQNAGLKPRSIQLKLASLRSFYNYCLEENLVKKSPVANIKIPQPMVTSPTYLNRTMLAELREVTLENQRDRAIIETLYATGVRASELLNIRLEDIKWDSKQIWIRKGKGNKERFVLFTTHCAERLKEYLNQRAIESPYLFANKKGGPLSRVWLGFMFRGYSKKLNLGFKVTPHTMRHTMASHLAEKGMPLSLIQELLGHANINNTQIYTRLSAQARKQQYDSYQ